MLRLSSNGTPEGTYIRDKDTGTLIPIKDAEAIIFHIAQEGRGKLVVVFANVEVDVEVGGLKIVREKRNEADEKVQPDIIEVVDA